VLAHACRSKLSTITRRSGPDLWLVYVVEIQLVFQHYYPVVLLLFVNHLHILSEELLIGNWKSSYLLLRLAQVQMILPHRSKLLLLSLDESNGWLAWTRPLPFGSSHSYSLTFHTSVVISRMVGISFRQLIIRKFFNLRWVVIGGISSLQSWNATVRGGASWRILGYLALKVSVGVGVSGICWLVDFGALDAIAGVSMATNCLVVVGFEDCCVLSQS